MATLRELLQLQAVISDDDVYMLVPVDEEFRYLHTYDLRDKNIFKRRYYPPIDEEYKIMREDTKLYEVDSISVPTPLSDTHNFYVYKDGKVLEDNIRALLALREEKR